VDPVGQALPAVFAPLWVQLEVVLAPPLDLEGASAPPLDSEEVVVPLDLVVVQLQERVEVVVVPDSGAAAASGLVEVAAHFGELPVVSVLPHLVEPREVAVEQRVLVQIWAVAWAVVLVAVWAEPAVLIEAESLVFAVSAAVGVVVVFVVWTRSASVAVESASFESVFLSFPSSVQ